MIPQKITVGETSMLDCLIRAGQPILHAFLIDVLHVGVALFRHHEIDCDGVLLGVDAYHQLGHDAPLGVILTGLDEKGVAGGNDPVELTEIFTGEFGERASELNTTWCGFVCH